MRTMKLGSSALDIPAIAVGCMRIDKLAPAELERFVESALAHDANFFDHADIYGGGECEKRFGEAIRSTQTPRESLILQSKCGIRDGMYDLSREHILASVDGSLSRLNTDYLDVFLLHRPDTLVEPDEVAEAFELLAAAGKVRHFGVSNHTPGQIELLKRAVGQPLVVNQLQLSIANASMISSGFNANMANAAAVDRDGYVLDYCRLNDITIQPWSPLQFGFFEGVFLDNDQFPELNAVIDAVARQHQVSNVTVAIAWLLRHPARMQPVTGTTNIGRLMDCCRAVQVAISTQQWYAIYRAAGNVLP
ncbi:MAG: aldo/keto reductase [Alphaproteobacteria bacterium]|nr:MAG: aldo/keto reductase [Alphaproteobacteria bacterium]PZO38444.1 MAG: aldo/keto reductase [Alphaproteobacteria bacterium]